MKTHPYDDIEAYVLGGLDESSAQLVMEHADSCPICAVLLSDAMSTVRWMLGEQSERPIAMTPDLQRLLKKQSLEARASRRVAQSERAPARAQSHRFIPWSIAGAALAACVVLLMVNLQIRSGLAPASRQIAPPIAALVHSHFLHHALRGSGGSAKVIVAVNGEWLYVVADKLRPNAHYVFYEIIRRERRPVGTFSSSADGDASAFWRQSPTKIEGFIIDSVDNSGSGATLRWP